MTVEETVERCAWAVDRGLLIISDSDRPEFVEELLSALKPGNLLPGGNVVMPAEPTDAMRLIFLDFSRGAFNNTKEAWSAMLAAAGDGDEPS